MASTRDRSCLLRSVAGRARRHTTARRSPGWGKACVGAASPPPDASGVLAQHDLHAAVLGLAGVVGVRRHRPVEPEALHGHARRRDALAGQRVRDRLGTALGQVLVVLGAAVGVGVALDGDLRPVEVGQQLRDLGELGRRGGLDTFEVQV